MMHISACYFWHVSQLICHDFLLPQHMKTMQPEFCFFQGNIYYPLTVCQALWKAFDAHHLI